MEDGCVGRSADTRVEARCWVETVGVRKVVRLTGWRTCLCGCCKDFLRLLLAALHIHVVGVSRYKDGRRGFASDLSGGQEGEPGRVTLVLRCRDCSCFNSRVCDCFW